MYYHIKIFTKERVAMLNKVTVDDGQGGGDAQSMELIFVLCHPFRSLADSHQDDE